MEENKIQQSHVLIYARPIKHVKKKTQKTKKKKYEKTYRRIIYDDILLI